MKKIELEIRTEIDLLERVAKSKKYHLEDSSLFDDEQEYLDYLLSVTICKRGIELFNEFEENGKDSTTLVLGENLISYCGDFHYVIMELDFGYYVGFRIYDFGDDEFEFYDIEYRVVDIRVIDMNNA